MSTTDPMDNVISRQDRVRAAARRVLPAVLVLTGLMFGVSWLIGLLTPTIKRSRVRTGVVERGPLEAVLTATGTVRPSRDQVISSPVEARVLRVVRQPGALLERGEPILELDVGRAALEVERTEGAREQKRNQRIELELRLEERLIDLRTQLSLRGLDIEELDYQVEQEQRLFDEGLISENKLRATLVRRRKAEIEKLKVQESVANSRGSLAAQIASLDAELTTLERELAQAKQRASVAITRADRAGVLTFVVAEVGATVREGEVLARIADPHRFRVEATIADVYAPRLREGQAVRVPIGEQGIEGSISRILPAIEEGALGFWVELTDPANALLRANMRSDVLVIVERVESALRVPKGPATNSSGLQRVFVIDGKTAHRRDVRLGLSGYRHYEVIEGLNEGDSVILSDMTKYLDMKELEVRG